jgi:hypothetical protein
MDSPAVKKNVHDGPAVSAILNATIASLNIDNSLDARIESGQISDMARFVEDLMLGSSGKYGFIFKLKVENQAIFINALSQARFNVLMWKSPERVTGRPSYFSKPKVARPKVQEPVVVDPTNLWDLLDVDKLARWVEDSPHEVLVDVRYYQIMTKLVKLDAVSVVDENGKPGLLPIFMKNYYRFPSTKAPQREELRALIFDMLMASNGNFDYEIFAKSNTDIQMVLNKYQAHVIKLLNVQNSTSSACADSKKSN